MEGNRAWWETVCSDQPMASFAGRRSGYRAHRDRSVWSGSCVDMPHNCAHKESSRWPLALSWSYPCLALWLVLKPVPAERSWILLALIRCRNVSSFSESFQWQAFPFSYFYNFEISIITGGRADLFSLLLCHPIVRMAPPFLMSL